MPDVEPLRFPSREGRPGQQDQADLQAVCSGRRRICALLNSPLPCVNKAIYHMQELKMTVENWNQQSVKYQPHIDQEHPYHKCLRCHPRDSDTESVTLTELFVEGIAITARGSCPLTPLLKKINDVLGEVMCLIERLEADRQYAEEAVHKERRRKRLLESKVDSISLWKQQEHSLVVQKEHNACIRDIAGLKWRLKLEREKLGQAQEKLSHAEASNQRLHEDISFAKKQLPVVKENLDLQRGIITQISTAQAEADEVYSKTQKDHWLVQTELQQMDQDINNERTSRENVLLTMKNHLADKLEELKQLRMLKEGARAEITAAERTIALTEEKCEGITRRIPEVMELEKTEKDRISQFELQIEDEMQQNKKLKENIIALREDIEKNRLNGEAEVSCIEERLNSRRNAFARLCEENTEYEQNVEDYKIKLHESEKAVKQMREERTQMLQKIIDNDKQWEKAKEEVAQVVALHSITQTDLEEQEQLTFVGEQRSREEMDKLRKDLSGQMTALEQLKRQCAHINEELCRQQRRSEITKLKLDKEFKDASSATNSLETKVEKIKKLTEALEKIQCDHRNALDSFEREKKRTRDHLKVAQDLHVATIKRHENTADRISDLTKKCEECREASGEKENIAESMPDVIADLQSVFDASKFKYESAAVIMSTLQSDISNCQQRSQRCMQIHTTHITARRKQMEDAKRRLKTALKENTQLASEYEGLKKILMEAEEEVVSALSERNYAHKSFDCYAQLSLLQKRMHKALAKYFKQRSLYIQAELDRCQTLPQETDQKISTAQDGLSEEIQLISAFLQSLTDDSTTTR